MRCSSSWLGWRRLIICALPVRWIFLRKLCGVAGVRYAPLVSLNIQRMSERTRMRGHARWAWPWAWRLGGRWGALCAAAGAPAAGAPGPDRPGLDRFALAVRIGVGQLILTTVTPHTANSDEWGF